MIAALPMYARPELDAAHDAFWAGTREALRATGVAAPEALNRDIGIWDGWQSPALLLGQICGLPYRARLHHRVTLVAAADYGLADTLSGWYRSVFVTRAGDTDDIAGYAGRILAYSEALSHSGWAAPQIAAAGRGFAFTRHAATGAHRASARAVADGTADIAAIDAVTWRGIVAYQPDLTAALQVIDRTQAAPGLAFVTAPGNDPAPIRAALAAGLAALDPHLAAALGILAIVAADRAAYLAVPTPPAPDNPASSAHC